jgi:quinone-modifying oxidoreductase subunit QmoC
MTTLANPMAGPIAPGVLPQSERDLRAAFLKEIERIPGGGRLNQCIQCGTCTASCPVSYAMDVTPRQVVGMFRAGAIEELLKSRTIWICASCYHCTLRCPAQIQITDLIYALKRIAIEEEIFPKNFPVHVMSETFTKNVKRYGRNYEVGLLLRYFLRTKPTALIGYRKAGFSLWRHGRIRMRPEKIKGTDQLRKIIAKAETFDLPQEKVTREKVTASVGYESIGR